MSDCVFPGGKIFEFYFDGTNFKDYEEYNGPENFQGLNPRNFGHWIHIFEKCILDLTEI